MSNLNISDQMAIAEKALDLFRFQQESRLAAHELDDAYREHKEARGLGHIQRGSPEWETMLVATAHEYGALQRAKRQERNAQRRLDTAIRGFTSKRGAQ